MRSRFASRYLGRRRKSPFVARHLCVPTSRCGKNQRTEPAWIVESPHGHSIETDDQRAFKLGRYPLQLLNGLRLRPTESANTARPRWQDVRIWRTGAMKVATRKYAGYEDDSAAAGFFSHGYSDCGWSRHANAIRAPQRTCLARSGGCRRIDE